MVRLENSTARYIGVSGDVKPTSWGSSTDSSGNTVAHPVPAGSSFLEADTGRIYRYDGDRWQTAPATDDVASLLSAVLDELRAQRALLEAIAS